MSQIKLTFILFRMVRNYVCKTQCANWNEDQIRLAISAVEKKELSIRKLQMPTGYQRMHLINRRVNGRLKNLSFCGERWSKSMPNEDGWLVHNANNGVTKNAVLSPQPVWPVCVTLNLKMIWNMYFIISSKVQLK
jgi:hypothetical protein